MDRPAWGEMPWLPRKTRSKCRLRIAASATGPTSASEGVRTPPVSTTVGRRGARRSGLAAAQKQLGDPDLVGHDGQPRHRGQLAGQRVRRGPGGQGDRAAGLHQGGGGLRRWPPWRRSPGRSWPRSPARRRWTRPAPPRRRAPCPASPSLASTSRSRRIVMSDTENRSTSSVTRTPPAARTSRTMAARRCPASSPRLRRRPLWPPVLLLPPHRCRRLLQCTTRQSAWSCSIPC